MIEDENSGQAEDTAGKIFTHAIKGGEYAREYIARTKRLDNAVRCHKIQGENEEVCRFSHHRGRERRRVVASRRRG